MAQISLRRRKEKANAEILGPHGSLSKPTAMANKWQEPPSAAGMSSGNSGGYVFQSALK